MVLNEKTLQRFVLIDAAVLEKVVSQLRPATCVLDPIPTSLFKTSFSVFKDDVIDIVNYSLQTGVFPTAFKTACVFQ